MEITEIAVRTAPFSRASWLDARRVSTPMSGFPEHAANRSSWRGPGSDLVWVLIRTDDPSVFGVGQARGGAVTAALIEEHLRMLLVGRDGTAVVRRTQEMERAVAPYAAGGLSAMAVGACELALWDLAARAVDAPLRALLGGSTDQLPYYLTVDQPSTLAAVDPAIVAEAAVVKVPMARGPVDGLRGVCENLQRLEELRALIPDHVGIAVDCFMSWDVAYSTRFARDARGLGLDWIEEALHPDDLEGGRELRARLEGIRVAGGEHTFGLGAGVRLVESRAVDVVQQDITWCGGLAVAQTVARLALDSGFVFAPHTAALHPWALHLLSAMGPGVLAEILVGLGEVRVPEPGRGPGVGIDPSTIGFA